MKARPKKRRPEGRNWERKGRYKHQPWNNPHVEMQLFVAPWMKEKLGLACKTTEEYLEECREASPREGLAGVTQP